MPDEMTTLVVTTTENRIEVQVPVAFLVPDSMDNLLSNLRERGDITLPTKPVLTQSEGGEMVLHEQPSFG